MHATVHYTELLYTASQEPAGDFRLSASVCWLHLGSVLALPGPPTPVCPRWNHNVWAASLSVLRGPRPPVSDREAMLSCRLLSGSSGGESVHCLPLCSGLSVCPFVRVSSGMAAEAALRIRRRHRLPPRILLFYCPQSRYHPLCRCVLPFAR